MTVLGGEGFVVGETIDVENFASKRETGRSVFGSFILRPSFGRDVIALCLKITSNGYAKI